MEKMDNSYIPSDNFKLINRESYIENARAMEYNVERITEALEIKDIGCIIRDSTIVGDLTITFNTFMLHDVFIKEELDENNNVINRTLSPIQHVISQQETEEKMQNYLTAVLNDENFISAMLKDAREQINKIKNNDEAASLNMN